TVLVCERESLPVDKVCGEGILPGTLRCLEALGVRRHLEPLEHWPIVGIRIRSPSGHVAGARFAEGPGWGTTRLVLSEAFARRAGELPNLWIWDRAPVRLQRVLFDGVEAVAGGRAVTARLIVGADGLRSPVRAWAGLDGSERAPRLRPRRF